MSLDITTSYSKQDKARLQPHLSNWMKTHAYIRKLQDNEKSLLELSKLISVEIDTRANVQIVSRLQSRYVAIRRKLEDQILFGKLEDAAPKPAASKPAASRVPAGRTRKKNSK